MLNYCQHQRELWINIQSVYNSVCKRVHHYYYCYYIISTNFIHLLFIFGSCWTFYYIEKTVMISSYFYPWVLLDIGIIKMCFILNSRYKALCYFLKYDQYIFVFIWSLCFGIKRTAEQAITCIYRNCHRTGSLFPGHCLWSLKQKIAFEKEKKNHISLENMSHVFGKSLTEWLTRVNDTMQKIFYRTGVLT